MRVKLYGTRGSIAVPEREFVRAGGNTPCILLRFESGRIAILDAGTGIRNLGNDLLAQGDAQHDNIFIALSHTHWDHIQGFPFFKPAYDPRRHFTVAIPGGGPSPRDLRSVFASLMHHEFFPVPLEKMGASLTFWEPSLAEFVAASGVRVRASPHEHPGGCFGYRIQEGSSCLVYCTDVEHGDGIDPRVVELARGADLLIHDAQYTPEDFPVKRGWGHSSVEQALEVARRAGVGRLALFHHDPEHDDARLDEIEDRCRGRGVEVFLAREGMEILI